MYLDFGPVSSDDKNTNVVNWTVASKVHAHVKPQNVTLFRITVFADIS